MTGFYVNDTHHHDRPRKRWTYTRCLSKNAPNLKSCSSDKHELILTTFGDQHQHAFNNDVPIPFLLSLYLYLLYRLLNSSDGEEATLTFLCITSCAGCRHNMPLLLLQVDNIFVFIRQVALVPACWLFKISAVRSVTLNLANFSEVAK